MGTISSGVEGKRMDILGKKIRIENNGGGEENQVAGNHIHPRNQGANSTKPIKTLRIVMADKIKKTNITQP